MQNLQFKKWSSKEEETLLEEISNNISIIDIAKSHDRSKRAIEIRLLDIAVRMKDKGICESEITEKTGMTMDKINKRIEEVENEKKQRISKLNNSIAYSSSNIQQILNELNEIKSLLKSKDV